MLYIKIFTYYFQTLIWKLLFFVTVASASFELIRGIVSPFSNWEIAIRVLLFGALLVTVIIQYSKEMEPAGKRRQRARKWTLLRSLTKQQISIVRRNKHLAILFLKTFSLIYFLSIFIAGEIASLSQSNFAAAWAVFGLPPALILFLYSWKHTKFLNVLLFPLYVLIAVYFGLVKIFIFLLSLLYILISKSIRTIKKQR